jgi:rhodanese-related sulfurtransferase
MPDSLLLILFGLATVCAFLLLKRIGLVRAADARKLIAAGAAIVDVRSAQEFKSGNLAKAINIPLDQLEQEIASKVPDKKRPVLLHCLSGGRSALAKVTLKRLGYSEVHNLGSIKRARQILENS